MNLKKSTYFIIGFFAALISILVLLLGQDFIHTQGLFKEFEIDDKLNFIGMLFTIIAGVWVAIQYYSNQITERRNHLILSIESIVFGDNLHLKTTIKNPTLDSKNIDFAFLEIRAINTTNSINLINDKFKTNFTATNDYKDLKNRLTVPEKIQDDFFLIPLDYYNKENIRVGNENLSYSLPISKVGNEHYEARFYLYRTENRINSYHRIVQCSFSSNSLKNENFFHSSDLKNNNSKI